MWPGTLGRRCIPSAPRNRRHAWETDSASGPRGRGTALRLHGLGLRRTPVRLDSLSVWWQGSGDGDRPPSCASFARIAGDGRAYAPRCSLVTIRSFSMTCHLASGGAQGTAHDSRISPLFRASRAAGVCSTGHAPSAPGQAAASDGSSWWRRELPPTPPAAACGSGCFRRARLVSLRGSRSAVKARAPGSMCRAGGGRGMLGGRGHVRPSATIAAEPCTQLRSQSQAHVRERRVDCGMPRRSPLQPASQAPADPLHRVSCPERVSPAMARRSSQDDPAHGDDGLRPPLLRRARLRLDGDGSSTGHDPGRPRAQTAEPSPPRESGGAASRRVVRKGDPSRRVAHLGDRRPFACLEPLLRWLAACEPRPATFDIDVLEIFAGVGVVDAAARKSGAQACHLPTHPAAPARRHPGKAACTSAPPPRTPRRGGLSCCGQGPEKVSVLVVARVPGRLGPAGRTWSTTHVPAAAAPASLGTEVGLRVACLRPVHRPPHGPVGALRFSVCPAPRPSSQARWVAAPRPAVLDLRVDQPWHVLQARRSPLWIARRSQG